MGQDRIKARSVPQNVLNFVENILWIEDTFDREKKCQKMKNHQDQNIYRVWEYIQDKTRQDIQKWFLNGQKKLLEQVWKFEKWAEKYPKWVQFVKNW